jgi:hypothetical protein
MLMKMSSFARSLDNKEVLNLDGNAQEYVRAIESFL